MKKFSTRRGRPRSTEKERDNGTPELQRKKQAGETQEVMDMIRQHFALPEESLKPAYYFRWLHSLKFGLPYARTTSFDQFLPCNGRELSEQERAEKGKEYRQWCDSLAGRGLLASFMAMVIYNQPPQHRRQFRLWGEHFCDALIFLKDIQQHSGKVRNNLIYKA